jgi:hypothetical protein
MDAEVYKITVINGEGSSMINYVLPSIRRQYKRMMLEEYGNLEEEGLMMEDCPEDVQKRFQESQLRD